MGRHMQIDINKKYRTRDGRKVRIYATDGGSVGPIHGAIYYEEEKRWYVYSWCENGRQNSWDETMSDLIEVKPRIQQTVWLNIYPASLYCAAFASKEHADQWVSGNRLACVKVEIDCEEGEGL